MELLLPVGARSSVQICAQCEKHFDLGQLGTQGRGEGMLDCKYRIKNGRNMVLKDCLVLEDEKS